MIPAGVAPTTDELLDERARAVRPIPADLRPQVPTNAVMLLARIRTEERRLRWTLEGLQRPRTPERVLTLLEDALLSCKEAGDHLEHVMTYDPAAS